MPRLLNGRRVACSALLTGDGTWAEYMVTSAQSCIPLNKNVSLEQGTTLLVNPLSALAIFDIAQRGKHRAIVSTAAASALGGMILRLGKRRDIPIIHVVRREAQVDGVRGLGGEYVLNSSDGDFVEQLRTMAHKLQATLLLDAISGSIEHIVQHAQDSRIHTEFPKLAARLFQEAMAAKKCRPCSKCCRSHLERISIYFGCRTFSVMHIWSQAKVTYGFPMYRIVCNQADAGAYLGQNCQPNGRPESAVRQPWTQRHVERMICQLVRPRL